MDKNWKEVDFKGLFKLILPRNLLESAVRGIDSNLTLWEGQGITVRVDHGLFSDPLVSYVDRPNYDFSKEEIDGCITRVIWFDQNYGSRFVAAHFHGLAKWRCTNLEKFTIFVEINQEMGNKIPERIIRSVRFLRRNMMSAKTVQAFAPVRKVKPLKKGGMDEELGHVQDFLQRFGYLEESTFNKSELDEHTSEALKKYQRANGRRATGEFNKATREQMTTHRCGNLDMRSGIDFVTLCAWDKDELTFAFDIGTNDIGGSGEFQAVRNAFQTWAEVIPLTFREISKNQNPDIMIGWRPSNDPDHSMVGGVLAHADFPPGCSVVTNSLPKPVHFDDQEHAWTNGAAPNAFDVETVALHEIGHILGLAHSNVAGSVMFASVSSNSTKRVLTPDDISGVQALYPTSVLPTGTYTIQQKSSNRFMDAHQSAGNDFSVVTRTAQNNNTQRWILTLVGGVYTVQQKSNNRFMDAHVVAGNDFSVVTRTVQNNDTQKWVFLHSDNDLATYTVQQLSSGRFMDAHVVAGDDFSVVTRTVQNNDTQRWTLSSLGNDTYTLRQLSNGRFMDAHGTSGKDFSVVTRTAQNNNTQRWILKRIGGVYTMQQKSNGRNVDAHQSGVNDFSVVTRTNQNNDTQRWVFLPDGANAYTVQQLSSHRFMDAHQSAGNDFSVVTRTRQNNDTQRWLIKPL